MTKRVINTGAQLRINYELLLLSLAFEANEIPPDVDKIPDTELLYVINSYLIHFECIPFTHAEIYSFVSMVK